MATQKNLNLECGEMRNVIVLEDTATKCSRRAARIRKLKKQIISLATNRMICVGLFSREQARQVYFADGQGTKYTLAKILADRFPDEIGFRLPPKRRPWMSEDSRMDIYDAVGLALIVRLGR